MRPSPRRLLYRLLIVAGLLSCGGLAGAADTGDEVLRPVREGSRADRGRQVLLDGMKVNQLAGNVHIWRDSLNVFCDSALNYVDTSQYDFFGKVRAIRGRTVLTCESAFYNRDTGDAEFHTNVKIVDGDMIGTSRRGEMAADGEILRMIRDARVVTPQYVVWADTIVRFESTEEGEAFGNVRIVDPAAESLVTSGHAIFSGDGNTAFVDRGPQLTSREPGADPVISDALEMYFYRQDDMAVLVDSVRIRQGRTVALADSATIYGRERVVLRGTPQLDDGEGSTMTADEIVFHYTDGELTRVNLQGSARVVDTAPAELARIYRGLPPANELTGDTIVLYMADRTPYRSLVLGQARSLYVPDASADEVSCNDVAGDTIVIDFANRRIRQVDVLGHMKGQYAFLRLDQPAPADSLAASTGDSLEVAAVAPADSARSETVDFTARRETVDYNGKRGLFQLADRQIIIQGDGQMIYGSMDLRAQDIRLDTMVRELYASGDPLLIDREQKLAGKELGYNFQYKTGAVREGVTAMDDYYYVGKHIKRFDEGEMKIRSGKMTSCDLDVPHYHFWADRMKIKMQDKMVAMPIVMKVGRVPVFALPFYFKSMKSGRRSGILFPTFNFGWSERTGRYVRDWGYYWATNDYTDFTFRGDYNDRRELTWQINNVYRKRYAFDGNITYSKRSTFGSTETREWQLRWGHNQQTLFDYYKLRANIKMSSKSISRSDLINDVGQEVISGQQTSTVYLSRSWSEVNASLNFKRDEYVNAEDDNLLTDKQISNQTFPQLSVNFRSRPVLSPLRGSQEGNFLGDVLRSTYFRHSYDVSSTQQERELTRVTRDSAKGSVSLDIKPPRILFFNVSTGVSSGHTWTRDIEDGLSYSYDDADSSYTATSIYDETQDTRTSLSINSSLTTTLYGIVKPRIGRLRGLRHTMRLSVNHRLSPSIIGKQTRSESYSFSLGNRFDLKYVSTSDTDSTEQLKKLDGLLDWSLSTSYNPDRDKDERWGTINNNFTFQPGNNRNLKLTLTNTIDPQAMRVTSTRIVYGLNISGKFDTGGQPLVDDAKRNSAIDLLGSESDSSRVDLLDDEYAQLPGVPYRDDDGSLYDDPMNDDLSGFGNQDIRSKPRGQVRDETEGGIFLPWRFGSNFSYSKDHISDRTTARVNMNVSATLSRNWKFSYRTTYDLETGTRNTQSWNLERDLHCWQMKFSRSVSAVDSQYGFVISLKAMPDIKVTRGKEDLVGGLGRLGGGVI